MFVPTSLKCEQVAFVTYSRQALKNSQQYNSKIVGYPSQMLLLPVVIHKLLVAQVDIRPLEFFCFVIPPVSTLYSLEVILIILQLVFPGLTCFSALDRQGNLKNKDAQVYNRNVSHIEYCMPLCNKPSCTFLCYFLKSRLQWLLYTMAIKGLTRSHNLQILNCLVDPHISSCRLPRGQQ